MELLFLPFVVLMAVPLLPLLPAAIFAGYAWAWRRGPRGARRLVWLATILWLAYGVYETRMYYWSKTVIAPIRVDLLLIAPVTYLVTGFGIWGCIRLARGQRNGRV